MSQKTTLGFKVKHRETRERGEKEKVNVLFPSLILSAQAILDEQSFEKKLCLLSLLRPQDMRDCWCFLNDSCQRGLANFPERKMFEKAVILVMDDGP